MLRVKSLLYHLIYILGFELDEDADETLEFEVQQKRFNIREEKRYKKDL